MANAPIAATSANISGEAEVLDPNEAIAQFTDQVEDIIEGPIMPGVLNSILDLTKDPPIILREGGISTMELKMIIPHLQTNWTETSANNSLQPNRELKWEEGVKEKCNVGNMSPIYVPI